MLKRILQRIYPQNCVLCGASSASEAGLCVDCQADLLANPTACARCALPLAAASRHLLCGQCLQKGPVFDAAWSPFIYAQPLEWMIHQLKFNGRLLYAKWLAELACKQLPQLDEIPDCILPVPLHPSRLRARGFNQALELARPLARALSLPLDSRHCRRLIHTSPQTGMDAKQRRKNIRGAFSFENPAAYDYVVVFDDVITTGSTVSELARVIKREGVRRVDVWSLARADKSW
ncbi:MAG: ComF family protein [Gammaproteobacteria bacterium]|nr:ComF family protein [Gammaproteobacteria bacterium]